uniref:G_PROTEIN_RECEP_F1_2 domain-containing protein n=1 Tax=Angiostrongylus cantonensis TaxID=6313 RepID=A0A0K0CWW5_ANGCA
MLVELSSVGLYSMALATVALLVFFCSSTSRNTTQRRKTDTIVPTPESRSSDASEQSKESRSKMKRSVSAPNYAEKKRSRDAMGVLKDVSIATTVTTSPLCPASSIGILYERLAKVVKYAKALWLYNMFFLMFDPSLCINLVGRFNRKPEIRRFMRLKREYEAV